MSFWTSCSCKLMVWVETTILQFLFDGGGKDGGDEIGKRFADPRAGLDHEVLSVHDGVSDRVGHVELLAARLVALEAGER